MRVCVWFYLAFLFSCVGISLLRNVETARSTSGWHTVRNLMRRATRASSTENPSGSRSSRSRLLSSYDSVSSRLRRLLSGRRNSNEEIQRQGARLRTQDSFSSPSARLRTQDSFSSPSARLRTQDSFSSPYGEISPRLRRYPGTLRSSDWEYFRDHNRGRRSDPGDWSNQRVVTYDWRGDIYLIRETHFTNETYACILEQAQRDARSRLRFRGINVPGESEPLVLVRTHVDRGTRSFVFVRREFADLDFLPADGSLPEWLSEICELLNQARIAAGLPPHTGTPRRSPTPSPVRSPKRGKVDPRDEEAPDTDDENEAGSGCKICMERMIKLSPTPCNHEVCYTCTQTMSGRRINENQPVRSFNCPSSGNKDKP